MRNANSENYYIRVFDPTGKLVMHSDGNTSAGIRMDLRGLKAGIYYYSLISGSDNYRGKFIVE